MDLKKFDPKALNLTIAGRFRLKEVLGKGTFGQIYSAVVNGTNSEVAIKLEKRQSGAYFGLSKEAKIISELQGKVGFPTLFAFGQEDSFDYMAITMLGANLEKYHKLSGHKFPLKTTLMIADQILTRIESLHSLGYLHRDIKPENFMMGLGSSERNVFLIDFGLAHKYLNSQGKHIVFKENKGLVGTARYASINSHNGYELSRRDDLESIGYMLIYFAKGKLPWQSVKAATVQEKYQKIGDIKKTTHIETLCKDLPKEFATYLNAVRQLSFQEVPNYKELRKIFRMLFLEKGFDYDYNYGWDKSKVSSGTNKSKTPKFKLGGETTKNDKETSRSKGRIDAYPKPNKYLAAYKQMDEVVEEEKIEESCTNPDKPVSVTKETQQGTNEEPSSKPARQSSKNSSQKHSEGVRVPDNSDSFSSTSEDLSIKVNNDNEVEEEIPLEVDVYASPAERINENLKKMKGMTLSSTSIIFSKKDPADKQNRFSEMCRTQTSNVISRQVLIDETTVKREILERAKTMRSIHKPPSSQMIEDENFGELNDEWAGQSNLASKLHSKRSIA